MSCNTTPNLSWIEMCEDDVVEKSKEVVVVSANIILNYF
jgi:hypothetical protein